MVVYPLVFDKMDLKIEPRILGLVSTVLDCQHTQSSSSSSISHHSRSHSLIKTFMLSPRLPNRIEVELEIIFRKYVHIAMEVILF